jgi:hypothetical protein
MGRLKVGNFENLGGLIIFFPSSGVRLALINHSFLPEEGSDD